MRRNPILVSAARFDERFFEDILKAKKEAQLMQKSCLSCLVGVVRKWRGDGFVGRHFMVL